MNPTGTGTCTVGLLVALQQPNLNFKWALRCATRGRGLDPTTAKRKGTPFTSLPIQVKIHDS